MAAMPRVPRICVDCGSEYTVSVNQASRSKRCPACQDEARRLDKRRAEARRYEAQRQARERTDAAHWHPMYGDTWPRGSVLTKTEIKSGIELGSFEPGTLFDDTRDNSLYRIAGNKLVLLFREER